MGRMQRKLTTLWAGIVITMSAFGVSLETRRSIEPTTVAEVSAGSVADLIVIKAGYDSGLRLGMVCEIRRKGEWVGEILLTDLRRSASIGLILRLQSGMTIRSGDSVTVKTVQ